MHNLIHDDESARINYSIPDFGIELTPTTRSGQVWGPERILDAPRLRDYGSNIKFAHSIVADALLCVVEPHIVHRLLLSLAAAGLATAVINTIHNVGDKLFTRPNLVSSYNVNLMPPGWSRRYFVKYAL